MIEMNSPLTYKWNLRFNDGSKVYVETTERMSGDRVVGVTASVPNLLALGVATGIAFTSVDPEDDGFHHDAIMALCRYNGWLSPTPALDMLPMDYTP